MPIELEVAGDEKAASRRAAELIAAAGDEAAGERGRFTFAISGGRSPWAMLAILGDLEAMPWEQTELFQVDERVAAPGDPDRNLTHMVLGLSMAHQSTLRPMPVTQRDLDAAAREYEAMLPERFDLVHLGLGPDGHTASLVPGDPALHVTNADVATSRPYQGRRRMTLTFPIINRSRRILWLVTGGEKAEALVRLRDGDRSIPASRVRRDRALILADRAAAERLGGNASTTRKMEA
jgi:6-phosphogluconolactonase